MGGEIMREGYDLYLTENRCNVYKAYCWIEKYIPEVLDVINFIDNAERQALKYRIVFWEEYQIYEMKK